MGAAVVVAALLVLAPADAQAQWCSYQNRAPGTRCDVPLETLPPSHSEPPCVAASFDAAVGFDFQGEGGTCVGFAGTGCCAFYNANFSTGSAAFAASLRGCLDTCTLELNLTPPTVSLPEGSAGAGISCNWPRFPTIAGTCENTQEAKDAFEWFQERAVRYINYFIQELTKFIDLDVNRAATAEILTRLAEYNKNLYPVLNAWWDDGNTYCDGLLDRAMVNRIRTAMAAGQTSPPGGGWWWPTNDPCTSTLPALKAMMTQISIAKVLQTMQIGLMLDSRALNEKIHEQEELEAKAIKRYTPGESACQMDMVATGKTKAYEMSRGFTFAMTRADTLRRNNHIEQLPALADAAGGGLFVRAAHAAPGSPLQPVPNGLPEQLNTLWREYVERFCDPERGDQGCNPDPAAAASFPGMNTGLPEILWEGEGTLNLDDGGDNLENVQAMLRTLISPFAPPPIPPEILDTAKGREELIRRRARDARLNAIYNVMAQLATERFGGSGQDTNDLRTAAGLPEDSNIYVIPGSETDDEQPGGGASLEALREATAKTQYFDPLYVIRLVNEEGAVQRDQNAVDATINETTYDFYRRMEELMFMEAANFAADLDSASTPFSAGAPE